MASHTRRKNEASVQEKPAIELIQAFSACSNFPKDRAGVEALANALQRWAQETGITMSAIVDECMSSSSWCPTPYDLRGVALSMRDKIRQAKEGNKHAEWERIYGPADPNWSSDLVAQLMHRHGNKTQKQALREQTIRDMFFYTEGDGRGMGDREYWQGPRRDGLPSAREYNLANHRELVERIRAEGGWRTERERQGA